MMRQAQSGPSVRSRALLLGLALSTFAWSACSAGPLPAGTTVEERSAAPAPAPTPAPPVAPRQPGPITLAFAGDIHLELHLDRLLDGSPDALGPIARTLRGADLAMVNLETAITGRGVRLHEDYAFRTRPQALGLMADSGVDVVTMANNHAVDYGPVGLADTLDAVAASPVPVVGIGADRAQALAPHRVSLRGTDFAFFGSSAEPDQLLRSAAGRASPGIAASFEARPRALLAAVRAAAARDDVVVVYLHWGKEYQACPTSRQTTMAQALADAGADVVVGSHAHVLLGGGWLDDTFVGYGLGNFVWYHDNVQESGVLEVTVEDGEVVAGDWVPAQIQPDGRPFPLAGRPAAEADRQWQRLRSCTGLSAVRR